VLLPKLRTSESYPLVPVFSTGANRIARTFTLQETVLNVFYYYRQECMNEPANAILLALAIYANMQCNTRFANKILMAFFLKLQGVR
jgi:hypothetical protein